MSKPLWECSFAQGCVKYDASRYCITEQHILHTVFSRGTAVGIGVGVGAVWLKEREKDPEVEF